MNNNFKLISQPNLLFKKIFTKIKKKPFKSNINGVIFNFDFTLDAALKEMYCGTYEQETVSLIKSILKNGDTFIDIGANIGYISALALGLVGNTGKVYSFEPVPRFFDRLVSLKQDNLNLNFFPNQLALGDKKTDSTISISHHPNIGWNTMVPGLMKQETIKETFDINTIRLDEYIFKNNITLIKIDTEGYEFPVLLGLLEYFSKYKERPKIICEIVPNAYSLLGYTLKDLKEYMTNCGYKAYSISSNNLMNIEDIQDTTNILFMA